MKYFGPPQAKKDFETQIEVPTHMRCFHCDEPFEVDDVGTINDAGQAMHHACTFRILGSAGHHLQLCSCFGGDLEDPEWMTKKQAAVAALKVYQSGGAYNPFLSPPPKGAWQFTLIDEQLALKCRLCETVSKDKQHVLSLTCSSCGFKHGRPGKPLESGAKK
jgi:ribosomal protein L37E